MHFLEDNLCVLLMLIYGVYCLNPASKKLHFDLMTKRSYNKLITPHGRPGEPLTVKLGMRLSQILDVHEKNQIMKISVWLRHEWYDLRLAWDPDDYNGLKKIHIPSDDLWRPDIVLYNNADGEFVITLHTKATVFHTGQIVWEPPSIYASYCPIDIEFFPFDIQHCFLKFGSWTYDGILMDLQHICTEDGLRNDTNIIPRGVDLTDYNLNAEWDVLNVTARRHVKYYPCCLEPYTDLKFYITIRRRTLFYSVNLIMPCISVSCLTVLVFFLPSDSRKKITLSISILLALTVFFLLLSDINPPTSLVIPLIGKYLLFVMIIVTMSIFLTVYTVHINFKTPSTYKMSPWVRRVFTEILPKILFMKRPDFHQKSQVAARTCNGIDMREVCPPSTSRDSHAYENLRKRGESEEPEGQIKLSLRVTEALRGVKYIADHMKKHDKNRAEIQDWKYIAMVMDRFFLYIFTTGCFSGMMGIFLYAPSLYDPREPMTRVDPNSSCVY